MNHDLLNDESLSIVIGGRGGDGSGPGTGGGDGLGWLRRLLRGIFRF